MHARVRGNLPNPAVLRNPTPSRSTTIPCGAATASHRLDHKVGAERVSTSPQTCTSTALRLASGWAEQPEQGEPRSRGCLLNIIAYRTQGSARRDKVSTVVRLSQVTATFVARVGWVLPQPQGFANTLQGRSMQDNEDAGTPPQDTGMPDAVETDPAALNSSEDLDEDHLRVDPLEKGVEPPEQWSEADHFGTTGFEQQEGASLEERLSEEQADVQEADPAQRPVSATPADQLDESIDHVNEDVELVAPEENVQPRHSAAFDRDVHADEAGGSIAHTVREPDESSTT